MLIDTQISFKTVKYPEAYFEEGVLIRENEIFKCMCESDTFYVWFKNSHLKQLMSITPDYSRNLDADGGTEWLIDEVLKLIDSLVSDRTYI